ncbi:hypothetical protein ASD98_14320 [Flavobacterium sp. Root186]|nr:hypothetical protein ASD98_14320 [Flavobacterium sp. Root186]
MQLDFNYRILKENRIEIKPQGRIGIIDFKEFAHAIHKKKIKKANSKPTEFVTLQVSISICF